MVHKYIITENKSQTEIHRNTSKKTHLICLDILDKRQS